MEKNRKVSIVFYLAAAACYVCSVIWFCTSKAGLGAMWLCIGSMNLLLGTTWTSRANKEEAEKKAESEASAEIEAEAETETDTEKDA